MSANDVTQPCITTESGQSLITVSKLKKAENYVIEGPHWKLEF